MGSYSRVKGFITFSPPVTYDEVRHSGFAITEARQNYVDKDVMLESYGPASDDDDLIYIICASSEDPYKAYNLIDDLKELVAVLGPDRTYTGYLEIRDEDDGHDEVPLWRLRVKDGTVVEVKPKLVWPKD